MAARSCGSWRSSWPARFTVRPLARLATRATLQRDLVVAATEAERARLAADIHDDALQELTLLVRRLEASGDTEGAEIGRTVADRLRAICGDLRLPILDDLGVGPALDWLVLRIERLAGGEVRLERADDARHSPDVELAIFRVAQEALANAVKHGKPPIVVRYRSTPGGISLAIDDAGPRDHRRGAGRRREGRPVRAAEHGPAGRADRGDPRRQALADAAGPTSPSSGGRVDRPRRTAPSRSPIRLLIVDDHPVVRDGTAALLAAQPGIDGRRDGGLDRRGDRADRRVPADVLLLDIRLGTDSGLRLLTETGRRRAGDHRPDRVRLPAVRGGGAPPRARRGSC